MFTGDDPLDLRDVACLTAESKRIHGEYASHVDEHADLADRVEPGKFGRGQPAHQAPAGRACARQRVPWRRP
jgi:hypothetical protein